MLKRSTLMVAAIAACGATLGLGASTVLAPDGALNGGKIEIAASLHLGRINLHGGRNVPHKFMRVSPDAL